MEEHEEGTLASADTGLVPRNLSWLGDATGTPLFWRVVAGMACSCLSIFLMNSALFPLFDEVFTYTRDISITFEALVLIGLAVASMWRPSVAGAGACNILATAGVALGCAVLALGLAWHSAPLLVVGACLAVTGRAWASINVSMAAVSLPTPHMMLALLVGTLISYCLQVLCTGFALPAPVGAALAMLVLPVAMLVLCGRDTRLLMDEMACSGAIADVSVVRPMSFLPLTHTLYVLQFVMFIGFGFALRFGEVGGAPSFGLGLVVLAMTGLLVAVVARRGTMPLDGLCNVAVLLLLAGFMLVISGLDGSAYAANTLLLVGNALYSLLMTCTLVALAGRNRVASLPIFCWGNGLAALGTTFGALLGTTANAWLSQGNPDALTYLVGGVALACMAYVLFFLRGFSFRETIDGVVAPEPTLSETESAAEPSTPSSEESFAQVCQQIAAERGLTARESETFAMLARGRNREYIESALQVSRNTVKAHVKHVYAKLDIHSHQELLDLVESRLAH